MPINQVLLSNTFNEFRTTVNEISDVVNNLTANVLSGTIVANTITVGEVSSNLIPSADITYDLGSSTNRWNDLYLSGNTIYIGDAEIKYDNGEITFTTGGSAIPLANVDASNITLGTLSSDRLATSGVSAGGYGSASAVTTIVVDDKGRITSATNTNIAIDGSAITSGTINTDRLATSGVSAGGYGSATRIPVLTIDDKGRITAAANATVDSVSNFAYYPANSNFILSTSNNNTYTVNLGQDLGTGANVTFNKVTVSAVPTSGTDLANKEYVDNLVTSGIHFHSPVRVESPTNLTATYNNGTDGVGATLTNSGTQTALVIDGVTVNVNDRVLIYQQTDQKQNGIYVVTNVGSGSTNWVLTRATDADSYELASANGLSEGSSVFVQEGTTGAGELYTCNTSGTITFGTTNITFAQINSSQIYSAGTGLSLNGTQFSLANTAVVAGGKGSASSVAQFVVDAQGRITSASNVAIAISSGAVSGLATSATTDTTNATNINSGTLSNARTTANTVNSANTLVVRDANGSFSANVVTASFSGSGALVTNLNMDNAASGTLAVARGGTGVTSSTGTGNVVLSNSPTLVTPALGVPASGNAVNLTFLNASSIGTGTVAVGSGGTGQTSYTNGQLLIGNSTGNTLAKATLTASTGISITNGAGSITIAATNNGTVTSVAAGTGLNGGTITSSGTISMPNVGSSGSYAYPASISTDAQGRVTSITAGTAPATTGKAIAMAIVFG